MGTVGAKSFQELPLRYSVTFNKPQDGNLFSVNPDTGEVRLQRRLVYIEEDRFQFRGSVTVSEQFSGFSTTTEVSILGNFVHVWGV